MAMVEVEYVLDKLERQYLGWLVNQLTESIPPAKFNLTAENSGKMRKIICSSVCCDLVKYFLFVLTLGLIYFIFFFLFLLRQISSTFLDDVTGIRRKINRGTAKRKLQNCSERTMIRTQDLGNYLNSVLSVFANKIQQVNQLSNFAILECIKLQASIYKLQLMQHGRVTERIHLSLI